MATSQSLLDVYVPTFDMKVGKTRLESSIAKSIMEITVTEHLNGPNSFSFRLNDPKLTLIDKKKGPFTEGRRIEIDMGFVGNTRKMIVGEISALSVDLPNSGPTVVEVQGFDLFHGRLTRGTVYRQFGGENPDSGLRDSEIVAQIAAEMRMEPIVKETPPRTSPRIQKNQTNLDFLQELALENKCFVKVDSGTIYFGKDPPLRPDLVQLEWGKTLLSFSPRLSTAGLVKEVVVRAWDRIGKQPIVVSVQRDSTEPVPISPEGLEQIGKGSGGRSQRVIDVPVASFLEAKAIAESILRNQQATAIAGSGTCLGDPLIRVGGKLEIRGIGRFTGTYSITKLSHTLSENGYFISFEVNTDTSSSASDSVDALGQPSGPARRSAPSVVVGLVLDNQDPSGLGRVKVNLPGLSENASGHWARVAAPMAGRGRGMFFLPEKDDEVLVAFEQGDITRPYVLGALWNIEDKPPETNINVRVIKSRSGHSVRFDDTDGAEKIEIIDKSGENSVMLDTKSNTISIKSAQDVVIEAPRGKISLRAKTVEVKSTAETKVEAQTSIDLKANATMTMKGQRVNIN